MKSSIRFISSFRLLRRCCLVLVFSFSLVGSALAHGGDAAEERACLKEANQTKRACEQTCRATFKTDVGVCTSIDPACRKTCWTTYRDCVKPLNEQLETCTDTCEPAFKTARGACREQCSCTGNCVKNPCFRQCVNSAVIARFVCKQDCRDTWLVNSSIQDALQACYDAKKSCVSACKQTGAE